MATRWGIVSAGQISHDFVNAVQLLPKEEHVVVAIVSSSLERSKQFATKFNIPKAYGSYEELTKDKDIDVLYIGTVHTMHLSICKLYLGAGYNVLCEKPLTINTKEAKELVKLAREKQVFFMEAFWSRCFPIYKDLQQVLSDQVIGKVRYVNILYGRQLLGTDDVLPRIETKELAGGALLGLGCYCLQLIQLIFNQEKPLSIKASACFTDEGVDGTISASLVYSDQRMANFTASLTSSFSQTAAIYGSKVDAGQNCITMNAFQAPDTLITPNKTFHYPIPEFKEKPNYPRTGGMTYEAQSVRDCLLKGLKENPLITLQESLQIMEIMDEIRKEVGLSFDADV